MSHKLVIKDAVRQLLGRLFSAAAGFAVIKLMTPYLGVLRYGDYSTILKYFALRSALADFGLYVIAVSRLGKLREKGDDAGLQTEYSKFVGSRILTIVVVYLLALAVAYLLPAYTANPYLLFGLPLGMVFSATFMLAGILQLPLQIFRKMEQLSIALVLARLSQIAVLAAIIFRAFPDVVFDGSMGSVGVFLLVIGSVFLSALVQAGYVFFRSQKLLRLRFTIDLRYTRSLIKSNRRYGTAYYLSSFHTLVVLFLLSNFFPTAEWNPETGLRALALAVIEIFLIVPAALGNSLLHKISGATHRQKRQSFGNFFSLILLIGSLILVNLRLFPDLLVRIIAGTDFLTTPDALGADFVLPFLGIVLLLSFAKQVFNYLFVTFDQQNRLFFINLTGLLLGLSLGFALIPQFRLAGGVITQVFLEVAFFWGAVLIAARQKILPLRSRKKPILLLTAIFAIGAVLNFTLIPALPDFSTKIVAALVINAALLLLAVPQARHRARGLASREESPTQP